MDVSNLILMIYHYKQKKILGVVDGGFSPNDSLCCIKL